MDSVKQSAALCLLRLNRTSPDLIPMGEWTSRVVHLLNDQHLVWLYRFLQTFSRCVVGRALSIRTILILIYDLDVLVSYSNNNEA